MEATIENIALKNEANLEVFSKTLQRLAAEDRDIIVVTSDSRGSGKLVPFGQKFPDQIVEVGIAEQNLVGVSAGLASTGKKVFAVSPACFLTARALEQIKNDVAYSDNPVKLIGISAGVSYGALGSTHHSLHDFAVLRTINNLVIVAPADNFETEQAIRLAAESDFPVYLRFGKKAMPLLSEDEKTFEFGKGRIVREGGDINIIATGETVAPALQAAEKLERESGISASVVSMHTIKPLDYNLLNKLALSGKPIITVEEHSVYGGLGEACASYFMQTGHRNPFKIIAIPDEYTVTGSQQEIFAHYGISEEGIAASARKLCKGL
ncbi:transketolase family protein [Dyadobacter aurulentus]|uniref:transketolase family protein n=1 Tax=Dyadobacter sp. UC 10 TaxID=2605428 RepID=UPI0011F1DA56|nr:transketolase C-terminal domain-containing protein [Dyadobacter sp. UC 10]KAA0993554.1 transketolase family protein [Dyadobacter sp. UC 10]